MGISEILSREAANTGSIILFKEGIFWRAYERSAFFFVSYIKAYRLTKRYFKNVGCEVVYCGFPHTALNELLANYSNKEVIREESMISIYSFEQVENDRFNDWKNGVSVVAKEEKIGYALPNVCGISRKEEVLQSIRSFRVVNSTPLECQQFLIEMQKQLDGAV
ncbi:MAG: hypothetical protein WBI34_06355 [Tenuifilaceae bacterium]|jgi:hypothetical protein|nr:hypothetical protein [Bacteroidales bacterium]MDI9515718.1 hypothetical protein [Bacteroidota bacterium]NLH56697.1 hypothetical protein [Rikenellaceae bacterium]OQC62990.1 MAG: hypothetical protein BWX49_01454 [Bacteroidetes bacterium ADurb.Bin008]HNV82203.1 hypothetical protein [Tenuifilaceae bacterium]